MISNFTIGCPGCRRGIRLRVGIGHETVQRFYFLCPHCQTVVLGALGTDQDRGLIVGLEIDGKPAVWVNDPEAVVTVFTELPIDPAATSMEQFGGSPFIMHHQVLGEPFAEWMTRLDDFTSAIDANWQDIRRWWGYYVRQDWPLFDSHAREHFVQDYPAAPTMLHRHDSVHRTLMNLFAPLFVGDGYLTWKMTILRQGLETHVVEAAQLAQRWAQGGTAANAQEGLFDVIDQFVVQRWTWMPGLLRRVYEEHGVEFGPTWRITRDDFRDLRDLFITTFERSHKQIGLLLEFNNCLVSGDPELYPDGSRRSRTKVNVMKAHEREALLDLFDPWGPQIKSVLDRNLRNSIGHGHATHNLESGRIVGPKLDVSYPEFVSKVASAIEVPLLLIEVVKYQLILSEVAPEASEV